MAGLTLDSGALIALEKHNREIVALIKNAVAAGVGITIPANVVAQTWRGNSPMIARALEFCLVEEVTLEEAKEIGNALAKSGTADVVDASVVVTAIRRGDTVVTSDPTDIRAVADGLKERVKLYEL